MRAGSVAAAVSTAGSLTVSKEHLGWAAAVALPMLPKSPQVQAHPLTFSMSVLEISAGRVY